MDRTYQQDSYKFSLLHIVYIYKKMFKSVCYLPYYKIILFRSKSDLSLSWNSNIPEVKCGGRGIPVS